MTEAFANEVSKAAHLIGLVPLIAVAAFGAWRHFHRQSDLAVSWWLLALAYGISWFADTVAYHRGTPELVAYNSYVMMQALLVVVVVAPQWVKALTMAYLVVGAAAITMADPSLKWPLHSVAWLTVAGLVWTRVDLGRVRWALLVTFGLGWCTWIAMQMEQRPGHFGPWMTYQAVRAAGTVLFCWALSRPQAFRSA